MNTRPGHDPGRGCAFCKVVASLKRGGVSATSAFMWHRDGDGLTVKKYAGKLNAITEGINEACDGTINYNKRQWEQKHSKEIQLESHLSFTGCWGNVALNQSPKLFQTLSLSLSPRAPTLPQHYLAWQVSTATLSENILSLTTRFPETLQERERENSV